MEGHRKNEDELMSMGECDGYMTGVRHMLEIIGEAPRLNVDEDEHSKIKGVLREGMRMEKYLHGPKDFAEKVKRRFRVEDLDLPERKKSISVVEKRK